MLKRFLTYIVAFNLCLCISAKELNLNADLEKLEKKKTQELAKKEIKKDQQTGEESLSIFDLIDKEQFSKEIRYNPKGKRDIFVIPWVVSAVNATRLLVLAQGYIEKEDYDRAEKILRKIISEYSGTDYAVTAKEKLSKIEEIKRKFELEQQKKKLLQKQKELEFKNLTLPLEAQKKISAVIWDKNNSYIIYGDKILRKGDKLPDFNMIKICDFSEPYIIFIFKGHKIKYEFKAIKF